MPQALLVYAHLYMTLCFCPVSDNVPEEVKSLYRPRIPKKGEDVWLIIGEFLSHKSSINCVLLNSTSTDDVFLDRLSNILLISVGFLHITEHLYLLLYLYKFLQSYYKKWKDHCERAVQMQMREFVHTRKGRSCIYVLVMMFFMLVGLGLPPISMPGYIMKTMKMWKLNSAAEFFPNY